MAESSDVRLARIKAIEARHGKDFMEVMADVHDHIFGATPPQKEPEKQPPKPKPEEEPDKEEPQKPDHPQPSQSPPAHTPHRTGILGRR